MNLILDFMILSLFLGLGWIVREKIPVLQRLFVPASVIGGVLLLICGPQVLGIVPISEAIVGYPQFLIIIILTALVFGSRLDYSRAKSYFDYSVVAAGNWGAMLFFGVGIGSVLTLIWTTMPPNWGIVAIYSFFAGHGAAGSAAGVYTELGYPDFMGIAMIVATVGLVAALSIGMPLINWGIRKGYTEFVDKPKKLPPEYFGGPTPVEKRTPIGSSTTSVSGINAIALQMFFLAACIMLGYGIRELLVRFVSDYFANVDDIVLGIVGAVIIWPIMTKTKTDVYVDKTTVNNISGFALEFLIVAAVGTLSISAMAAFAVPIIVYCLLMLAIMTALYIVSCKIFCREQWFEKLAVMFGQCIGNAATGLTLLRSIDPKSQGSAGDAGGVFLLVFMPIWVGMIALGPVIAVTGNGTITLLAIGLGIWAIFYGIGFTILRPRKKALEMA